jgi:hypothetical protein
LLIFALGWLEIGRQIIYTYDFGDNWEHYLSIEGRADPTNVFVCLDGSGHGVAEDAGGVNGWANLKAAYEASHPSREQQDRREWFERSASNCDLRGLAGDRVNAWDRHQINKELSNVFERFERMAAFNESLGF